MGNIDDRSHDRCAGVCVFVLGLAGVERGLLHTRLGDVLLNVIVTHPHFLAVAAPWWGTAIGRGREDLVMSRELVLGRRVGAVFRPASACASVLELVLA